ncbi:hypothetical protein HXX76_006569 [Chlamydomonas incerta]|uniref:Uncharacterized protein n=1 Tax=Chlamydomonas incerta TaxID=51695 RepID=A0A835W3T8_CHLIN|nr:hypothetical protein HXX76_006569 [Chlamydomonas incerta]|eukprot:KAG2436258.1 hypothetical protein HXX76_006569 [Chlamydomonas incerta]
MEELTQSGPDDDGGAVRELHRPGNAAQRTSHIRRRRRPPWSAQEERLLVEKHAQLGNAWMEISEFLPGRTAGEVKNIYHSTLRASRDPGRSLLRSYCMQIHGRESDAKLRREALRSAVRAMAAQHEVALNTMQQSADSPHYTEHDGELMPGIATAATTDVGAMDAVLASRDASLAQLRLLAAATGGEGWESDDGSGGGGGVARPPGPANDGAGARPPLLLSAGLGSGAAPHRAGTKRAATSEADAKPQRSDSAGSGDGRERFAEGGKRARVALLSADADLHAGLDGRSSGQASLALEGLLGAASLRDGSTRMQTLDLSFGGAAAGGAAHRLLAQQLQALNQVQCAQQQQLLQLREAQQVQQGQEQMLRMPDAALLQLLRDEMQARSRAPADALQTMTDGGAPTAADGQHVCGNKSGMGMAQLLNQESTPATSAGGGSGPRNARGSNGGGCVSQDSGPTGPAAMPLTHQQPANGERTAAAPRSPGEVTPMGGCTGAANGAAAANALQLAPAPVAASDQAARSDDRDSADTASDTAVGSGHISGGGVAVARCAASPGTNAWEAEQRRRIDRMLSYGISLDEIEEELLRRRQAKLAAEAAALGEAAAALAAGRRDVSGQTAAAPAKAAAPLVLSQGPKAAVVAEAEKQLKLEEQLELLQRPHLQIKADPDASLALDTQALRRQLLLELLKQQAGRQQQQQQLPPPRPPQPHQQLKQQQLSMEGLLRSTYAPASANRGLNDLRLQAAPGLDMCGSLGLQLPLSLNAPRGVGDLDAWLRANRSGAPNMWS